MPSKTRKTATELFTDWSNPLQYEDLPASIQQMTKLRILDTAGVILASLGTTFSETIRKATRAMNSSGYARILGCGDRTNSPGAAFANGALSQALEFDDTHNRSIVHMSGPSVSTALALCETRRVSGKRLITAVAIGNEAACRLGCIAPGEFHSRGFHPTGLFPALGTAWAAASLLELDYRQTVYAIGIAGSFASGLLECWSDGTQSKLIHPGWAAHSGIHAAELARAGLSGPASVLEGRFGLLRTHLQSETTLTDFEQMSSALGDRWESQNASFKPYPAAHVIHPYIDAALRAVRARSIEPTQIEKIVCFVTPHIVDIVCEPRVGKTRPRSDAEARVSLQYTIAEAVIRNRIDKNSYASSSLTDEIILRLANMVEYEVVNDFCRSGQFKGDLIFTLKSGETVREIEEHNRGSATNPMTREELIHKFEHNCSHVLSSSQCRGLRDVILDLQSVDDSSRLVTLSLSEPRHELPIR